MSSPSYSQTVVHGDSLRDACTYQDPDPKFLLVGEDRAGGPSRIPVGEQLLSRHMLLMGGIGTGKSNAFHFLIRNLRSSLTGQDVMIIFDTKGDYYKTFYRPGDVVISNDEHAAGAQGADYWNLFEEISVDGRAEENALEIANALFEDRLRQSSQPFFPNAAKDLFGAVLLHLLRTDAMARCRNNADLRSIFDTFSVEAMKRILAAHPDLKALRAYIEDERSGQTLGVVSELQQLVREIFVGNFKKKGALSMRRLVREKGAKVVFVEYDLGLGSTLTPIYKLLFDLAIKEALCRKENEGSVYFIIDEFRLLPNLHHIDDGVNFGRSLGAKFVAGVQNVDQISAAYGPNLAKSILSGFGTNISFRVSDANSREYVKGLYGGNMQLHTYLSAVQSRGISEELREGSVIDDADITSLGVGEAIVGILNCPPFYFKFNRFA